ncbi:MAG: Ig-like domain-containing protein [Syntrophomonas sp.]|nr:Ig-like domain-containing protein [Syntrophomonas sp.]
MNSCCQGGWQRHHNRDRNRFPNFQRPFVLISSIPRNRQTGVSPDIKAIKLIFGRDFNNDPGLVNDSNEIDMWQGMNKVPIQVSRRIDQRNGHLVILVTPVNPLLAGVTYKVRVKSVFIDRHGAISKTCRLIVFTTGCR